MHGKQVFTTNCIGCHGLHGDGKGPAARFINNPAPRNFTDVSASNCMFSDGEMYDAILFGVDGTAMPAWGDMLTVNDIWDVTNFIRTIPNGGLHRDPDCRHDGQPRRLKPIELTPPALLLTPQAAGASARRGQATPPAATATPCSPGLARPRSGRRSGKRDVEMTQLRREARAAHRLADCPAGAVAQLAAGLWPFLVQQRPLRPWPMITWAATRCRWRLHDLHRGRGADSGGQPGGDLGGRTGQFKRCGTRQVRHAEERRRSG